MLAICGNANKLQLQTEEDQSAPLMDITLPEDLPDEILLMLSKCQSLLNNDRGDCELVMGSKNVHNVYMNENIIVNKNMRAENVNVDDNITNDIYHEVFHYFMNMYVLDNLDVVSMSVTGGVITL